MDNLGLLDQFFYKADQYNVFSAIMGGASILEPTPGDGALDANAIATHLAARLGSIALLRTRFVQDPLRLGSVRKVEDPHFDIWDHILVESLPAPGGYEELSQKLAQLSANPLPLSQMWRWTVIDGLAGGRLAIMCNIHHAVADGLGMVEALSSMYDAQPVAPEKVTEPPRPEALRALGEPSPLTLMASALQESGNRLFMKTPRFLARNTAPILSALGEGLVKLIANPNDPDRKPIIPEVHPTSLNISEYADRRALSWKTLALPEIKRLARHFQCTVNDLGLLLYSFGMDSYFEGTGETIDFDLWCAVPVSTRGQGAGGGGNQVAAGRVCLHNTLKDPVQRLQAIRTDALEMKASIRPAEPVVDAAELAALIPPLALDATLYLTNRLNLLGILGGKLALANTLFSNVPGPRQPVYVANALVSESIPMIPAIEILAVSGGITSVGEAITIGFHCDGEVVTQPELFVAGVEHGLGLLIAASGGKSRAKRGTRPKTKTTTGARTKTQAKAKTKAKAQTQGRSRTVGGSRAKAKPKSPGTGARSNER